MKRLSAALIVVVFVVGIALSFFAGYSASDKAHMEHHAEKFGKYISIAVDAVEQKGLSVRGVPEWIASNVWVAYELCQDPEISSELNDLWNTLIYEADTLAGQEDALASQLEDILERYQQIP